MTKGQRVVITGMGAVTPIGNNVEEFWQGLLTGRCGVERIQAFDPTDLKSQVAAEVKCLDSSAYASDRELSRIGRDSLFAVVAVQEALDQYPIPYNLRKDTGVLIGSNMAGMDIIGEAFITESREGPRRVNPQVAMRGMPNTHNGVVSIRFGFQGGGFAPASACATGLNAIGEGFLWVQSGFMPVVIAGGCESGILRTLFASFGNLKALSTHYNNEPKKASRPFDARRDGFVGAEGSGVLVLMTLPLAKELGLPILAEIIGYGTSFDASNMIDPTGEGATLAIVRALRWAEILPPDVDYINAHATGTPNGDRAETKGIKEVFGDRAYKIPISSIKGHIGHGMGAAGAIESVAVVKTLQTGIVPPTLNWEFSDPDCDLDYVATGSRQTNPRIVLKNSFGFGGVNASLVLRKWEE